MPLKLAPVVLLALGYADLHSYYSLFGIQIYNYVDSFELFFQFAPALYQFALIIVGAVAVILVDQFRKLTDAALGFASGSNSERSRNPKHARFFFVSLVTMLITGAVSTLAIIFPFSEATRTFPQRISEITLISFFSIVLALSFMTVLIAAPDSKRSTRRVFTVLLFFVVSLGYVLSRNKIRAMNIYAANPKYTVTMMVDNEAYITDRDSLVFIGATRNYTFVLQRRDSAVVVFDNADLSRVTMRDQRPNGL